MFVSSSLPTPPIAALFVLTKDEMTISTVVSEKKEQQRGMTFDCICNRDDCTRESGIVIVCVQVQEGLGERETTLRVKEGVLMVYVIIDLMLRIRCKIEMNAAQLRFRYINLVHVKSVQRGRVS